MADDTPTVAAIEQASAVPQERPGPSDLTATWAKTVGGCFKRARLAFQLPKPPAPDAQVGVIVHRVLELAGRLRIHGTVTEPRANLRELSKILDELTAQGTCPAELYAPVREGLSMNTPIDFCGLSAVEEPFNVLLDPDTVTRASGTFDRVDSLGDASVVIHDYKSGAAKDAAQLERDPQTLLYLIAARELWPGCDRIRLQYDFLRFGESVTIDWTPELDSWGRTFLRRLVDLWYAGKKDANPGPQCGACEYSRHCEEGSRWLERAKKKGETLSRWDDLEQLAQEFSEVRDALKALKKYHGRLGRTLRELLQQAGKPIAAGRRVVKRKSRKKTKYAPGAVVAVQRILASEAAARGESKKIKPLEIVVREVCAVKAANIRELCAGSDAAKRTLEGYLELDRSEWVTVEASKDPPKGKA